MSFRYMSERYPSNHRNEPPLSSFHGERNFPRSRRSSPYFRDDYEDRYSSSKYPLEGRHISDHRMRDRSLSPRDRRRSQEPDLRDYLVASQYNRKLSDVEREGPNYNRTYGDYEMLNQTPDWKYDRNIDMKARMDKESIDLRNRELATRRDYRDDKYSFGSERDRRFPDLREELNNSRRGRYSPDRRDEIYLSEPRRDDNFDYRDKLYSTASRLEKYSSDFREESHFRRDRTSPDRRFLGDHRDQPNYREFITESDRHRPIRDGLPIKEFERDWQHPGQSHQDYSYAPGRDSRYPDPSTNHWRDQYPEERYERPYNTPQRMMPVSNDRSHNEFNQQGPRMDYQSEDNWRNGHPHWNDRGSTFNKNIPEPDNRRMASFPHVNNAMQQQSELVNTPFLNNGSLPANISEGDEAPLPRFTVLIQNLNNIHEPFSEEHIEYVKKAILAHWSEEKINRTKGNWLPSFLDCIPWRNGLAIVCQNKRSMSWLLKKKIKGYDGFFFAATNAATPIKKVKLWIQVPGVDLNPTQVLRKFQQCNRGHQIRFDRFKVVNSKEHNNGLNMIVLSDSWTVNKLHKRLNWRPRYGDRRIRIKVLGKKRTKPPSTKPGEVKKLNDEPDFDLMDEDSQSESYDEL